MAYDFNLLEMSALDQFKNGRYQNALRIYFFMAEGDAALDGGWLGKKIAQCYECLGESYAAFYWYGRAIEENPVVNFDCAEARKQLGDLSIDSFLVKDHKNNE